MGWISDLGAGALNYTYQTIPVQAFGGVPDPLLNPESACKSVESAQYNAWNRKRDDINKFDEVFNRLKNALKLEKSEKTFAFASLMREAVEVSLYEGKPVLSEEETILSLIHI
eukprot:TRINITY_DN22011_c0_g1_i2.p3 TRINITY_DN22011_c0_g1~~TRINITY_DN22011_c0_g1_i2.p3  ORF type:complete len:113 (-),score=20.86 TRINITY_DN22011_c0_g1_i2:157-495(-)